MTTAISECYVRSVLGYLWLCVSSALHGQWSEHVFKMAARVSSTSSVEMNTNANMTVIKFVDIFQCCFVC